MVGGDSHGFILGRDNYGSPGQVVSFPEEAAGALMDGGHRGFIEDVVRNPTNAEVVLQVFVHLAAGDPLQVAAGYDPGSKRHRGSVHQAVHQVGLAGKNDGSRGGLWNS